MAEETVEVDIAYHDQYIESFVIGFKEARLLKDSLIDEERETFSIKDQSFSKREVASVKVGGNWAVQFFDEE